MPFGDVELTDMVCVGAVEPRSVRIWVRAASSGRYTLCAKPVAGGPQYEATCEVRHDDSDGTAALWLEGTFEPDTLHRVEMRRGDTCVATALFRTPPSGRFDAPHTWSFGAFSCHQPFGDDGEPREDALSMLRAARLALTEADARFVLMMGDQAYADLPNGHSLFDDDYFRTIGPPGRRSILDCDASEVRALYHRRHRIFWGLPELVRLQRSFCSYPMLDDHEVVDNFGTHPDHALPQWAALRRGALQAYYDYQGARVDRRSALGPFDYGFTCGPAAIWMMDIRSQRRTRDGKTQIYSHEQYEAMRSFLARTSELPLLIVMSPIPFVYLEGKLVNAATQFLSKGSDLHERWTHEQSIDERDRILGLLLEHARVDSRQILLMGGDVHSGAVFEIDFDNGVRMHQLISSPITNREGWLVRAACEGAAHTVTDLMVDQTSGRATMLRGVDPKADRNPYGGLHISLVDVTDHGDHVAVRLRLVGHDGGGRPITLFDSGELGHATPPHRRLVGIADRI